MVVRVRSNKNNTKYVVQRTIGGVNVTSTYPFTEEGRKRAEQIDAELKQRQIEYRQMSIKYPSRPTWDPGYMTGIALRLQAPNACRNYRVLMTANITVDGNKVAQKSVINNIDDVDVFVNELLSKLKKVDSIEFTKNKYHAINVGNIIKCYRRYYKEICEYALRLYSNR